jgi:hypothetical protein
MTSWDTTLRFTVRAMTILARNSFQDCYGGKYWTVSLAGGLWRDCAQPAIRRACKLGTWIYLSEPTQI